MKALERFPVATAIILLLVVTGCADVLLDGVLSDGFSELLKALDVPLAGLALGRGLVARRR